MSFVGCLPDQLLQSSLRVWASEGGALKGEAVLSNTGGREAQATKLPLAYYLSAVALSSSFESYNIAHTILRCRGACVYFSL